MKKIAAFILPLLICAAVLSGGSLFAEEPVTISLTETAADPGSTVDIELRIAHNPGINTLKLKIAYDSERLTLLSAKNEGLFQSMNYSGAQTIDRNPYIMVWINTSDIRGDGKIGVLQFQVKENAAGGDAALALTCDFCTNQNLQNVETALQDGKIRISGETQPAPATPTPSPETVTPNPDRTPTASAQSAGQTGETTGSADPTEKPGTPSPGGASSQTASCIQQSPDGADSARPTPGASATDGASSAGKWWLLLLLLIPAGAAAGYFIYKKKKASDGQD